MLYIHVFVLYSHEMMFISIFQSWDTGVFPEIILHQMHHSKVQSLQELVISFSITAPSFAASLCYHTDKKISTLDESRNLTRSPQPLYEMAAYQWKRLRNHLS